jgi:hypothetical protein
MKKFEEIIDLISNELREIIDNSDKNKIEKSQKIIFSSLMISTASEITKEIIKLREQKGRNPTNWIQSCTSTRYLFELLSNHATLRNCDNEDDYWDKFLYLRKLQVFGNDTYGVSIDILPQKTREKLTKNNAETYLGWNHGEERIKENLRKSVKLENEHFQFSDPWGLTMFDKMKFIKTSNKKVFLSRWRMYSQISHASSFSIWPMWFDPVPHFDAIQCLSIIYRTEYEYHGKIFDTNLFCEKIYKAIK